MTKKTDIFVAIDTQSLENAKKLVNQLSNRHCGIKIGKELFTSCGPEIVQWVKDEGFKVLDMIQEIKRPDGLSIKTLRCPIRINNEISKSSIAAPKIGENTLRICEEFNL